MEKKITDNRGGRREGAGRPFVDKEKGKMHTHGITMHDDTWKDIVEEANELKLSASNYIATMHKKGESMEQVYNKNNMEHIPNLLINNAKLMHLQDMQNILKNEKDVLTDIIDSIKELPKDKIEAMKDFALEWKEKENKHNEKMSDKNNIGLGLTFGILGALILLGFATNNNSTNNDIKNIDNINDNDKMNS